MMLQKTGNDELNSQAGENDSSHNTSHIGGTTSGGCGICENINNLSTIVNLAKFKKPNLTTSKKAYNLDFTMANSSKTDFFISKPKKVLIL